MKVPFFPILVLDIIIKQSLPLLSVWISEKIFKKYPIRKQEKRYFQPHPQTPGEGRGARDGPLADIINLAYVMEPPYKIPK